MSAGPELPSGTVTFLFTDIEGSTRLLKQLREGYAEVRDAHERILREVFAQFGGQEIDTQGDSFFVAFSRARDAVAAAAAAQGALSAHPWPEDGEVRVRMGLHTGEPTVGGERYVGLGVHRASRICAAGHGGQVLLSAVTRGLVEDDLPADAGLYDLGEHRLKDIDRPEHLYQLEVAGLPTDFPPLRTTGPETPFAGREGELAEAAQAAVTRPRFYRRRTVLVGALAGVIAAAVAIPIFALGGGSSSSVALASIGANAVGAIDPETGRITASVPVGTSPSSVAYGEGSVWVTNTDGHSVSQIDPKTNTRVQTIQVGDGPSGIAVGGGFVWVANSLDGTLSQIDPRSEGVVRKIDVGNGPAGVAFGGGAVWVANSGDRTVLRIDPNSGARHIFPVLTGADAIAVGAGALWVMSETDGSVARVDPRTGTVQSINVGNGPSAVAVGLGAVWVANGLDGTVSRIDPTSSHVTAVIEVGDSPSGITVTQDAVWVSNELAGTLSKIDPAKGRVAKTVTSGNRPEGVASSAGAIYVAVQASGLMHRGGTLTVAGGPNNIFDEAGWTDPAEIFLGGLKILTNDGLTAYKRVGGSDGARLVPDLATSLPAPTDEGRTYTFQLRRGIHYSTGAVVRPADFRRAIERSFADPYSAVNLYLRGIVGGKACGKSPRRCDLSQGIVADPAANTVTFHLSAPDPDFLYQLALPFAFAVPESTPVRARLPLPATGPYIFASYDAKRGIRLVRNPRFHEWSQVAQPSGFPDEIVWRFGYSPDAQVRAVERGRADYSGVPTKLLTEVKTRFASQLRINPTLTTLYFSLNTRLPPFNDVRVRRALNYAVDRDRLVELIGGLEPTRPSCQVLPPHLTGYRPYCPYPLNLAEARRLVKASGTEGQIVTVWTFKDAAGPNPKGAYLVSVLQSLGYKARLKALAGAGLFDAVSDSRRKVQISGLVGWTADYPSASAFFSPLLTCGSYQPASIQNTNWAEFCNPQIDAAIVHAGSLQTSNLPAASKLWSEIDRDIVDEAPWVVIGNSLNIDFVSSRVGNYIYNPQWGVLFDQLWVR